MTLPTEPTDSSGSTPKPKLKPKVIVYTINFGEYDRVPIARFPDMYLITDKPIVSPLNHSYRGWKIHPCNLHIAPYNTTYRRASRYLKINSHLLTSSSPSLLYPIPPYDISIYIDSCLDLHCSPVEIASRFLPPKAHAATFRHANDATIFNHVATILRYGLADSPTVLCKQAARYTEELATENIPVTENCFLIRRNSPQVTTLNELWWEEYENGCCRDQMSFMYAVHKTQTPFEFITIRAQNARKNDIYSGWGQHRIKTKAERVIKH